MDFKTDFTVTKEEGSQVKIEGEIPFEELSKERNKAITHLGKDVALDGFRKGKVPEKVLVDKIGEMAILTEMAERALARIYPEIVKTNNIEAIGHPQIQITKIAPENPLGFIAITPVIPEVTLPDYKKLAAETNKDKASTEVTDEDVEKQGQDILRQKIAYENMQAKAALKKETEEKAPTDATDLPTPETVTPETTETPATLSDSNESEAEAGTHTHTDGTVHEGPAHDTEEEKEIELPELTDDYVKTLGTPGQFETVDDFKTKLREHLTIEKEKEVHASHRAKITDTIIDASEMELPQILIDSEIGQMFGQMEEDLKRANLKMDDYLGHIKKTKEDLVSEWKPAAEKRAKLQLILNEIAKKEEVTADKAQLETQVEQLLEQYKDADEARVRVYVESVMTNEAVMQHLESL
ncbi:MAG: trigger factor [Candidatus Azotimanducaceae bacterium]|jgi:trigger factor